MLALIIGLWLLLNWTSVVQGRFSRRMFWQAVFFLAGFYLMSTHHSG